jgi:hypothetical protein
MDDDERPTPRRRRIAKRRVVMGELNIISQPHAVDTYIEAFKALADSKVQVQYHQHRQIEIGICRDLDDIRIPNALTGYFFVFSRVNFDDPWLNIVRNAEATVTDLQQLNIPPHLAPEFRRFRYVFDVRKHRLYFEKYSADRKNLSSKAFTQAINKLLRSSVLDDKFEEINAFTISDHEGVEKILNLNKLRSLYIKLYRPNPDDEEFEEEVLNEMNAENVSVRETTLIKAPGAIAINASAITRKLAYLAAKFGFVEGHGKDDQGAPITADTETHPVEHNVVFRETDDPLDKMVGYIADKNNKEADGE